MVVAGGGPEAGDGALRHLLHVLVAALQDQRDLRVEGVGRCRARASLPGAGLRLGGAGFGLDHRGLGFFQAGFQRLDALFVGLFHLRDFLAQGVQVGIGGRRGDAGQRAAGGQHDQRCASHGFLQNDKGNDNGNDRRDKAAAGWIQWSDWKNGRGAAAICRRKGKSRRRRHGGRHVHLAQRAAGERMQTRRRRRHGAGEGDAVVAGRRAGPIGPIRRFVAAHRQPMRAGSPASAWRCRSPACCVASSSRTSRKCLRVRIASKPDGAPDQARAAPAACGEQPAHRPRTS
jgi:hypothetical protein